MATPTAQRVVNPANKERRLSKGDKPYALWTDPQTGWKYQLLKSWQANNGKAYARWMVQVQGWSNDIGDEYVEGLWSGLRYAKDLEVDETVWPSKSHFLKWALGTVE